jgi:hypothetical protein
MNKKNIFVFMLVITVAIVAIFSVGWAPKAPLQSSATQTGPAKPAAVMHVSKSVEKADSVLRAPPVFFGPETLPPPNVPLSQSLPSLLQLSASGNYRASCRLAEQVRICQMLAFAQSPEGELEWHKEKSSSSVKTQRSGSERDQAVVERIKQRLATEKALCEGFDNTKAKGAWEYQYLAAIQGHVPSMVSFAVSPALGQYSATQSGEEEGWSLYKQHASSFLKQAADSGNLRAIAALVFAHSRDSSSRDKGGIKLAERNDFEAAKYAWTHEIVSQGRSDQKMDVITIPGLKARLGTNEFARAQSEAMKFINRLPPDFAERQLAQRDKRLNEAATIKSTCLDD